ncbi:MAG: anthrone oxygenase family protein [Rhodococcus sp. (in: high G+C Gram-positive bacteria)]
MIENVTAIATVVAAVGTGLTAGVLLAFSVAVVPALSTRPRSEAAATMQVINIVIIAPVFLAVFLGSAVAGVVAVVGAIATNDSERLYIGIGTAVYVTGCVIVTAAVNVPLNNALAQTDPATTDGAATWDSYRSRWTRWNHARTAAATAACVLSTVAAAI